MTTLLLGSSHRALVFVALSTAALACGGQTSSTSSTGGGSGELALVTSVPVSGSTEGASYEVLASFTKGARACSTRTIGACVVDPCFAQERSAGAAKPNAGSIVVGGADMTAISLDPGNDGSYSSNEVTGLVPWKTSGETVMFQLQNAPGDTSTSNDRVTQATPPYVALTAASAFASKTDTLARDQDLALSWTTDSAATAADLIVAEFASSDAQVLCSFDASAANGVVPAQALASLGAGDVSYEIHSRTTSTKEIVDAQGASWTVAFNVETRARTSYGVAAGSVTLE